jgi:hypothetical protein
LLHTRSSTDAYANSNSDADANTHSNSDADANIPRGRRWFWFLRRIRSLY